MQPVCIHKAIQIRRPVLLGFSECEKAVLQIDMFLLAFRRRPFLEPIADKIVEPII